MVKIKFKEQLQNIGKMVWRELAKNFILQLEITFPFDLKLKNNAIFYF